MDGIGMQKRCCLGTAGDFRTDEGNRRRSAFFRGERQAVGVGEIEDLGRKE